MNRLSVFLLLCLWAFAGAADPTKNIVQGRRMEHPPTIDGVINDDEWKDVPKFEGLVEQSTGAPAPFTGTFWLAYDAKYIYFAARLQDDAPDKIVATEYRTNQPLDGNDTVSLDVDPFGLLQEANVFTMNASGGTNVQIAGGRAAKREWLGDFISKGRLLKDGWEVEARIPWKIMRLPAGGKREVRFNVTRYSARYARQFNWQYTQGTNIQNNGRWVGAEVPASESKPMKFLPYTFDGYDKRKGIISNAGLDARIPITDTLDFAGSINPDFRNVENAVLNLGFSYFQRLANESRPFFLEGARYFQTAGDAPIFASQQIPRFDIGGKFYGKLDKNTDIGILDTNSFTTENSFAFNIKHQAQPRDFYQVSVVNDSQAGNKNLATFEQIQKPLGDWTGFFQHDITRDTTQGYGSRIDTGAFYSHGGRTMDFEYYRITPSFFPAIGFAPETNFTGFFGDVNDNIPYSGGPLTQRNINYMVDIYRNTEGGGWYRREFSYNDNIILRKLPLGIGFGIDYSRFRGNNDLVAGLGFNYPNGNPYNNINVNVDYGRQAGLIYNDESLGLAKRFGKNLQSNFVLRGFTSGFDHEVQAIFSAQYDLGHDHYVNTRTVKQGHDVNTYVSYQRSGAAGMEYYIILGDPNAAKTRTALVVKLVMPFETSRR